MALHYYTRPDGVATVDNDDFVPPGGWTEVDLATYNAALAVVDATRLARQAGQLNTECMAKKAVYDDLKASAHTVDWAEDTFRALSGYTPGDC